MSKGTPYTQQSYKVSGEQSPGGSMRSLYLWMFLHTWGHGLAAISCTAYERTPFCPV